MTLLNGFQNRKWLNSSIWPWDETLAGTSTPDQNGPGSNGNETVLHVPLSSRTGASLSDG